jgi:hypothetical protein
MVLKFIVATVAACLTVGTAPAQAQAAVATVPAAVSTAPAERPLCDGAELARFVEEPPAAGVGSCDGIAPGSYYQMKNQSGDLQTCTFGFAFRGSDGRSYLHSYGSCYLEPTCLELLGLELPICIVIAYNDDEPVFAPGKGIPVTIPYSTRRIGELAYAIYDGTYDFSLIRLDKGVPFSPQVCLIGGPTGLETGVSTTPATLRVAHGSFHNDAVAVRGLYHPLHVGSIFGPFPATTGSPVLTQAGKALGISNGFALGLTSGDQVERTSQPLARAAFKTRLKLTLLTAKVL